MFKEQPDSTKINSFLFSGSKYYENLDERKKAALVFWLSLVASFISFIYLFINLIVFKESYGLTSFIPIVIFLLPIYLLRIKQLYLAITILLLTATVYWILYTPTVPLEQGNVIHSLTIVLAAFTLYSKEKLKYAYLFTLLILASYYIILFTDLTVFPRLELSDQELRTALIINIIAVLATSTILILFFQNITYGISKQLEDNEKRLLEKNKELTKINSELDSFVYSTSHDLRAPLKSVLGLVTLSKAEKEMNNIQEYLDLMEKSVLKLDNFIDDILEISRNSRVEVQKQEFDYGALITGLLDEILPSYQDNRIEIINEYTPGFTINSDAARLRVVLLNLITNSYKYHEQNRNKSFIKISAKRNGDEVEIVVTDNGHGIHEQHINNVFKMFYRATEISEGSGLGLYIVNEMVTRLNGRIQLDSVYRKGTTATITLPG